MLYNKIKVGFLSSSILWFTKKTYFTKSLIITLRHSSHSVDETKIIHTKRNQNLKKLMWDKFCNLKKSVSKGIKNNTFFITIMFGWFV